MFATIRREGGSQCATYSCNVMRVLVLSLTDSSPIPDGTLFTCAIAVEPQVAMSSLALRVAVRPQGPRLRRSVFQLRFSVESPSSVIRAPSTTAPDPGLSRAIGSSCRDAIPGTISVSADTRRMTSTIAARSAGLLPR